MRYDTHDEHDWHDRYVVVLEPVSCTLEFLMDPYLPRIEPRGRARGGQGEKTKLSEMVPSGQRLSWITVCAVMWGAGGRETEV